MNEPPRWTRDELDRDRGEAIDYFRRERLREPLEAYIRAFDDFQEHVAKLLVATRDVTQWNAATVLELLANPRLLEAVRYLGGPPISEDDLKTLAQAKSVSIARLREDAALVDRIIEVVRTALDPRRFPWVAANRNPTQSERQAAIVASAALFAAQRTGTHRRNKDKTAQELMVQSALISHGLVQVAPRSVAVLSDAPRLGQFCRETALGERKADFLVGLWDGRTLAIECKVSNSAINSVKRLNNDAAAKAEAWRVDFGATQVVPAAVLSGVFKLHNLENAQARGLTLFWAHRLAALTDWIERTRPS